MCSSPLFLVFRKVNPELICICYYFLRSDPKVSPTNACDSCPAHHVQTRNRAAKYMALRPVAPVSRLRRRLHSVVLCHPLKIVMKVQLLVTAVQQHYFFTCLTLKDTSL